MEQYPSDNVIGASWSSVEVTKLIRKLRWIGLTDEARRLQDASYFPKARRKGILADIPYSTD
jgi:hypothetical protein